MDEASFLPGQMKTIGAAQAYIRQRIEGMTDTPGLDAQVLLAHVTQQSRAWVLAHPEHQLEREEGLKLADALEQLTAGVPLPYVIGEWEFFALPFKVTPHVLIPRPETELLVEMAIEWLKAHPQRIRVAEAGTGSGCIAVSLAVNLPQIQITATDISTPALEVARQNARHHGVTKRIHFKENDLLTGLEGPFDLICANLPYIPSEVLRTLPIYKQEPTLALDGGVDGLRLIEGLLAQAAEKLVPGGLVLLEIEASLTEEVRALAGGYFNGAETTTRLDLAGRHRILSIQS